MASTRTTWQIQSLLYIFSKVSDNQREGTEQRAAKESITITDVTSSNVAGQWRGREDEPLGTARRQQDLELQENIECSATSFHIDFTEKIITII